LFKTQIEVSSEGRLQATFNTSSESWSAVTGIYRLFALLFAGYLVMISTGISLFELCTMFRSSFVQWLYGFTSCGMLVTRLTVLHSF